MTSVRAIVCEAFGAPSVMQIATRDLLELEPGAGQYLIRVGAAGINPSDTYVRLGPDGPYAGNKKLIPELPYTPGKDGAGVVEAVGEGCTKYKVGDRVYTAGSITGTYSEMAVCAESMLFPLPSNMTMEQGACVGVPCATAWRALFQRCGAKPGDHVLIHGASGAVGLAAVQLAASKGCIVVGTAGTPEGEAAVKAAGAQVVINHRQEGYLQAAKEATQGGTGFDIVLEMMASSNLANDLTLMGRYGRIGIIGSKVTPIAINPRLTMNPEVDIRGVFLGNATEAEKQEIHAGLFQAMQNGALQPIVALVLPLEEAPKGHVEVMEPSVGGASGNIVLSVAKL